MYKILRYSVDLHVVSAYRKGRRWNLAEDFSIYYINNLYVYDRNMVIKK